MRSWQRLFVFLYILSIKENIQTCGTMKLNTSSKHLLLLSVLRVRIAFPQPPLATHTRCLKQSLSSRSFWAIVHLIGIPLKMIFAVNWFTYPSQSYVRRRVRGKAIMCNNIFFLRGHFMVRMIFAVMIWELSINQVQLRQKSVLLDLFPSCETTYMHTVYALNDRNAYYQIPLKDREERKKEEWEERERMETWRDMVRRREREQKKRARVQESQRKRKGDRVRGVFEREKERRVEEQREPQQERER